MPDTISREDLYGKIQRGDPFYLFEVLPRMYWRKHHLPGARSLSRARSRRWKQRRAWTLAVWTMPD